jgi:hypothetical protein
MIKLIGNIIVALFLLTVPVTFFVLVASENLQNKLKSTKAFTYFPGIDEDKTAAYVATYFSGCVLILTVVLALFVATLPSSSANDEDNDFVSWVSSPQPSGIDTLAQAGGEATTSTASDLKSYEVVAIDSSLRNDDGFNIYVLIPSVDLTKNDYQARIENAIKEVAKKYGDKITVEIFDDKEALALHFDIWVTQDVLEAAVTPAQHDLLERHQIASYEGGLDSNPSTNSIILFPNSTNEVTEVSALSRHYEFKP